jgi:hypothetical protein
VVPTRAPALGDRPGRDRYHVRERMILFCLVLVLGGAAVWWHDFPFWMYAVLLVVSGWRMSLRWRQHTEQRRAGEAGPTGTPPGER